MGVQTISGSLPTLSFVAPLTLAAAEATGKVTGTFAAQVLAVAVVRVAETMLLLSAERV